MSAYFIANIKIKNEKEFKEYLSKVDGVFSKYNGKYLCVDETPEILEGHWDYSRVVLIEFPDRESLKKWYFSDEYQEILKLRLSGADCDTIIMAGN